MKSLLSLCLSTIAFLFASGCALSPQKVVLDPELQVSSSSFGEGVNITLVVKDERASNELGRRGMGMAKIDIEQNLANLIREKVTSGLERKGFTIVNSKENSSKTLVIELRALDYKTSVGFWTGGVHITGALKAESTSESSDYSEFYRVESEKRVMLNPTAKENQRLLNEGLTDLLRKLFEDKELFDFLGQ